MSVIIAGEKLLPMNQLISFCYGPSLLLLLSLSQSLCFRFASILRWGAWGLKEDRNGGKGASLKGIITVSPEVVHNHSV